jgi:hypothetical protein
MVLFRLMKLPLDGSKSDRQATKRQDHTVRKRQRNMDPKRMVYTPHIVAVNYSVISSEIFIYDSFHYTAGSSDYKRANHWKIRQ